MAHVRTGNTKSCGCFRAKRLIKHGHKAKGHHSGAYVAWKGMKTRTTNSKSTGYHNYGGRGITIEDPRWFKFENFLEDMGERPEGMQLDRIDNNRGYCKDNCRWVTHQDNSRNKRTNRIVTFNGKTQCIKAHSEEVGINYRTAYSRLMYRGWVIEDVFSLENLKHEAEYA
jgi:hypothetical protein